MKKNENYKTLIKHADKSVNKIIIPKDICEKYGYDFVMSIFDDGENPKIILRPLSTIDMNGKGD